MTKDFNAEVVIDIVLAINEWQKRMTEIFPKEHEEVLKHFAASALHLTLFTQDFYAAFIEGKPRKHAAYVNDFLRQCGCEGKGIIWG